MRQRELIVDNAEVRLAGTVCLPTGAGPFPFVVFIHGSGPLDRDENMPGQRVNVFNALAHEFANVGIASFRYDKRGCAKSTGKFVEAGLEELLSDAVACVNAVAHLDSCTQVFLVAHSEGCALAPLVVQRLGARISGMALLCPFLPPVEPILIKQAEELQRDIQFMSLMSRLFYRVATLGSGDLVAQQRSLLERIKKSTSTTIRVGFRKVSAKWLRELLALDATSTFRDIGCPVLLIGGDKDKQCDASDLERIRALLKGPVEAHVVPDLTHVLRLDPGPASLLGALKLLPNDLAPPVLKLTSQWLIRQVPNKS